MNFVSSKFFSTFVESAVREQSNKYDLCQVVYDETIEDGFHGFLTKLNHLLQLSVRLALRFRAREL